MEIKITEIKETDEDKIKKFDDNEKRVLYFLENRYKHLNDKAKKKEKLKTNLNMSTNTRVNAYNLVRYTYRKLFGIPENNHYDEKKLAVIEKHLIMNKLI